MVRIGNTKNDKIRKELQDLVNKYKDYFKILVADNEKIDEIQIAHNTHNRIQTAVYWFIGVD